MKISRYTRRWNSNKVAVAMAVFFACLTLFAFYTVQTFPNMEKAAELALESGGWALWFGKMAVLTKEAGIEGAVLLAVLVWLYRKVWSEKKGSILAAIAAFVFSVFMVLGDCFSANEDWNCIFGDGFQITYSFMRLSGYMALFYSGILYIIDFFEKDRANSDKILGKKGMISLFIFEAHPFGSVFVILFFCWLPWFIVFHPGTVMFDAFVQLDYIYGLIPWMDYHPVFSTVLIGGLMRLGELCGSFQLGVLFLVIFQTIILLSVFSWNFVMYKKLAAPIWLRVITLIWFAIFTVWPAYAQTVCKDTLFYALVLAYLLFLLDAVKSEDIFWDSWYNIVGIIVLMLFMAMYRGNGIFIAVLSFPFLIMFTRKRERVILCGIAFLLSYGMLNIIFSSISGAIEGGKKEVFSVPLQQTARYFKYHGDEVTEEERNGVNELLEADRIGELYEPELSDPIKTTYRFQEIHTEEEKQNEKEAIRSYLKVWFEQFGKHPDTYIQATLNNTYGYFYPQYTGNSLAYYYICQYDTPYIDTTYFNLVYTFDDFQEMRNAVSSQLDWLTKLPGIGLLYSPGTYTWILIVLAVVLLRGKDKRVIVVLIPALINLLICLASPVNGSARYMLPNMAMTPILIAWTFYGMKLPHRPQRS